MILRNPPAKPTTRRRRPSRGPLVFALGGAICLAVLGIASRVRDRSALRDRTLEAAVPVVLVVDADALGVGTRAPASRQRPGFHRGADLRPDQRIREGVVRGHRRRVRKGQKLADIESPEVDQQLQQARASLGTAKANEDLAAVTANRLRPLVETMAISRQEYDNAVGALAARKADTQAAQANVRRLEELVSFEKIEAPFDGVITARNTDVGQLVDAGSGTAARELFRIATTAVLRLYVQVPEASSGSATPGTSVDVTLAEQPGRHFEGKIARTAGAIDPGTRTLRVEVDLANKSGEILPGAFAQVHLKFPSETPADPGSGQRTALPIGGAASRHGGLRQPRRPGSGHSWAATMERRSRLLRGSRPIPGSSTVRPMNDYWRRNTVRINAGREADGSRRHAAKNEEKPWRR